MLCESAGASRYLLDPRTRLTKIARRVAKKLKLQESRVVIPSRRSLAACRPLGFLGRLRAPSRIGVQMGGDAWSGHAYWPTSPGRLTRSCCCGTNIWLLKTGF